MKSIIKHKYIIVVIIAIVVLALLLVLLVNNNKSIGYVTVDINNDSIVIGYNKDNIVNKVTGTDININGMDVIEGLDKVLAEYKDGTIILIGLEKTDTGKKIEKYFIEEYPGIDRHTLRFIYINNGEIGKGKLTSLMSIDSNMSIFDICNMDASREHTKDLDELEGYHSRD